MIIAVTYEDGMIFQHFGHTEAFKLYRVEDGRVTGMKIVHTEGSGHGALAGMLKKLGVNALICGGIGGGARTALANAGIDVYGGVKGMADAAALALISGKLDFNPDAKCDHHGEGHHHHDEGHACGNHGCGEHKCSE